MFFFVDGEGDEAKFLADSLRSNAVNNKRPTLSLSSVNADAHPGRLIEKLLDGSLLVQRPQPTEDDPKPEEKAVEVSRQKFRDGDGVLVVVGQGGINKLDEIEKFMPGFTARFGERKTIKVT